MFPQFPSKLSGCAYVIAGASGGIGRSLAHILHRMDASLFLLDISRDSLLKLSGDLLEENPDSPKPIICNVDISSEDDLTSMLSLYADHFDHLTGLINCAGILRLGDSLKTVSETSLDEWQTIIDVNLTGTFLLNRAFLPIFQRQRSGDIINISSVSGKQGRAFDGPYCASKFGVIGLTESIAAEVSSSGIRVQCLLPDAVNTDMWLQNGSSSIQPSLMMSADRVASVILYMLCMPPDVYLLNPIIMPMKPTKKRRRKS
jgi:3-oxoacyl-[acyl-carrier protein] reductase